MKQTRSKTRRKARLPGRKRKRKLAARALAAAGAIAGGTQAYAEPVRFDNPAHGEAGHFHWPPEPARRIILDFAAAASEQPGANGGPTTVGHLIQPTWSNVSGPGGSVYTELQAVGVDGFNDHMVVGVASGDTIPSGSPWDVKGFVYYPHPSFGTELPEGTATYLGVRFNGPTDWQYGWVGVVRAGIELEAFAWGYETEPGVPIAAGAEGGGGDPTVPTVSEWGLAAMSLSLLVAGTWVVRKRMPQARPPVA